MGTHTQPRVVVIGGGFGGLEAAFYTRMKVGDRAAMTLVSDQDHFLFKPNTIYVPFGLDPAELTIPLDRPTSRKGIRLVQGKASVIDTVSRTVTAGGEDIPYDHLVVATGASMRAEEIPGMAEHAYMIWTPEEMLRLRVGFDGLLVAADAGKERRVLFLVPPRNKCSGPLYEMVMMLDSWLRQHHARSKVNITWSTYEQGYIQAFGPRLNTLVSSEFDRRGIVGHRGYAVSRIEPNEVVYANGETLGFDLLVAFPPYVAATTFAGLPSDDRGFIATDLATRRVRGLDNVFAVGDAGDFPVKQAFLAFLQADAAADAIASDILGEKPSVAFDPISMCVMEQFDTATFAQVPLRLKDNGTAVEVRPDAGNAYRVGSSPVWRLGKKLLGVYLPWRFGAGEPFHAGAPWKGMEVGLKMMSAAMAS
ncbi:MAG: NAD(P)/FAD-dependent oxidoreductase [Chloroflexota bacterium]|nr:MAG: NAD(P)/FAD-dependent oxidoreductase [Chloroflexota bacterium]